MTRNLPVDADRLWTDVMALADITDPARPYTRRSFSPLFLRGRDWLRKQFEAAGLTTRIDAAGNLIGRRDGADPSLGVIAVGSHSDTVPSGGRFDGIAGVATGLEIARALNDRAITLRHSLEVIDFLAEEPSEYGLSCVGSRGMAGLLEPHLALAAPDGESLRDALSRVGGDPARLPDAMRTDLRAFLELHIEQGPVLEQRGIDVGIVTSIAGVRRVEIVFDGAADHAGTTPMDMRHDALVAGARTSVFARECAGRLAAGDAFFVATVGVFEIAPNAANVVPARCRMVIDIRTGDTELTERFVSEVERASEEFAQLARVARTAFKTLSDGAPVQCDAQLQHALRAGADSLGLSAIDLASGAGHDAAFMSRLCPAAMVFIPCREGKSHAPEEWAERDALAAGAAVMFEALMTVDARMAQTSVGAS